MSRPAQMSSKYLPSVTPRNTPPWCKPPLYAPIPPVVAGVPQYLVAYLAWKDPTINGAVDLTASIKLPWNATEQKWIKHQPGPGYSLGATVERSNGSDLFTLGLELWKDDEIDEDHEFTNVPMGPDLPWDSLEQVLAINPGIDEQIMQVWA